MRPLCVNLTTEQTTLGDFGLWAEGEPDDDLDNSERVERVLPWFLRPYTKGIEDNILQLYYRMTEEDHEDIKKILRDSMTEKEITLWPPSTSNPEDLMDYADDDRFIEQEPVAGALKWRVLWSKESVS